MIRIPHVVAVTLLALATPAFAEDVSAVLRAKTEQFSNAGQAGDGAALGRVLDDRLVFFNENGDQATKADLASSTPPPADGVTTKMTISDWKCEVHGNVAVASFIDEQQQDFHGQPFHARFRSVETWLKERAEWKMIASQTVALFDDPRAVQLPRTALDEYVGSYEAAPGVRLVFTRDGDTLFASNGDVKMPQHAELRDVFFTGGISRSRKVFERNPEGRVIGLFIRREGHDIHFKRVA